jgi:hypothetical protein
MTNLASRFSGVEQQKLALPRMRSLQPPCQITKHRINAHLPRKTARLKRPSRIR